MISHTDIPLPTDVYLDSLIIDMHVFGFIFLSAIVMLSFKM